MIFPKSNGYPWAWWDDFDDILEISGALANSGQSQWFPKVGAISTIPPYGWVALSRTRAAVISQTPWIEIPVLPFLIPIPKGLQDRYRFLIQSNTQVALVGSIYPRSAYSQIPAPRFTSSAI